MRFFTSDATVSSAAKAINALGVELLTRAGEANRNTLLSPFSIQSALAMTYAGADGDTRSEMAKVLHYPKDEVDLHGSFRELQTALDFLVLKSAQHSEQLKKRGVPYDPIMLTVANRLFGQAGYDFRPAFLLLVKDNYDAPFETIDFVGNAASATKHINDWVEEKTKQRICSLIPDRALNELTRLVLVNAIYLKAPWAFPFPETETKPLPFHIAGGSPVDVPTMRQKQSFGYAKRDGYSVVAMPYCRSELQFVVLLPDSINGLASLEAKLTASLLADCANVREQEIVLHMPKLKLQPSLMQLANELEALGMRSAFDKPEGNANFNRIAPRRVDDYLYISGIFHKTFLELDEKGTEAAAATAVLVAARGLATKQNEPVEVRVDRPFLFAILHRPSRACLFLGRVTDPR